MQQNPFIWDKQKIEIKAKELAIQQNFSNLQTGGVNIQKETVRVVFGLYRIVYMYGGQEYSIWLTGDGQNILYDELLSDAGKLQATIEQQKADIMKLEASLTPSMNETWRYMMFVFVGCIFFAFNTILMSIALLFPPSGSSIGTIDPVSGTTIEQELKPEPGGSFFSAMIAIGCGIGAYFAKKRLNSIKEEIPQIAQNNVSIEKRIAEAKDNLVALEGSFTFNAQAFKERMKPLRGIYESEVAGNPEAF